MNKSILNEDKRRYVGGKMPLIHLFFRKASSESKFKTLYKAIYKCLCAVKGIEIPVSTRIGGGLYLGHCYGITINPKAVIGKNVNIHKGVTIGQENRGKREGTPVVGNNVWIGVNATIVGKVTIGNDVLIAPNSYVNFDVPDHSIVIGNPGQIRFCENATKGYINRTIDL